MARIIIQLKRRRGQESRDEALVPDQNAAGSSITSQDSIKRHIKSSRCSSRLVHPTMLLLLILSILSSTSSPTAAAAHGGGGCSSSSSSSSSENRRRRRTKEEQKRRKIEQLEFITAMREVEEERHRQENRRLLTQRLLKKATFVPNNNNKNNNNHQQQQHSQHPQAASSSQQQQQRQQTPHEPDYETIDNKNNNLKERDLGNNNNNNNNKYAYNYYKDQQYIDGDGGGGGYSNNNNNNNNEDYTELDLSGYALKYTGCQNIHTWDDSKVGGGYKAPLAMNRFVTFRVCEAESCSTYNKLGCDYNYGEYTIPMEDYLSIMADYHFEQYGRYCMTCYNCMSMDYYKQDEEEDAAAGDDAAAASSSSNAYDDAYVNTSYTFGDDYWAGYRRYWYEPSYWDNGNRRLGSNNNNNYYQNQGGGAMNYYYGGNYYTDDAKNDDNKWVDDRYYNDDQEDNDHPWYADDDGKCIFEHVCSNFRYACRDFNPNATFYEDYYSCSAFAVGNNVGYLGPHCGSDGRTIGIGIYKDAFCSVYLADEKDIEQYTGYQFDSTELQFYYDKACISCSAIEGFSLITDDALMASRDITYPLCSMLYENSAKCNRALSVTDYNYQSTSQYANEGRVCDFIESLVENNYDEYGEIYIRSTEFELGHWQRPSEYTKIVTGASPGQIFFLVVSICSFLSLSLYSCYLTKKLHYRMPWRPPRSVLSPYASSASVTGGSLAAVSAAGRESRVNSGIVAMRSRSGEGMSMYDGSSFRGGGSVRSAMSPAPPFEFPTSLASTKPTPHTTTHASSGEGGASSYYGGAFA